MNKKNILLIGLMIVIIPIVLLLGEWSATDPVMAVTGMVAVIFLGVLFTLERNLWLLIPLTYAFSAPLTAVPGGFSARDVMILGVAVLLLMIWIIKRYEIRMRFGVLEGIVLLQYLWLLQAFVRNPAGLAVLGSATVGGRSYIELPIVLIGFIVLSSQVVDLKRVRLSVWFLLLGGITVAALHIVTNLVPAVGGVITYVYAISGEGGPGANDGGGDGINRREYMATLVKPAFSWLLAVARPAAMIDPRRPLLVMGMLIVIAAALLSGFRSLLIWIAMMYIIAALVRRCKVDIAVASMVGLLALCAVIGGNGSLFNLPLNVQRTLSFLPGEWDELASTDAEHSADWRYEMWEVGLFSDEFIENKWLGDGYGLTIEDLQFQAELMTQESVSPEMMQEHFMRSGDWHSGPVSTIHRVGYSGLVILTVGIIFLARYAMKMIQRAEGTSYYVSAMFIGLPMVVYPFYFYLVIGSHQQAIMMMTFGGGMLRLIENSMDKYWNDSKN